MAEHIGAAEFERAVEFTTPIRCSVSVSAVRSRPFSCPWSSRWPETSPGTSLSHASLRRTSPTSMVTLPMFTAVSRGHPPQWASRTSRLRCLRKTATCFSRSYMLWPNALSVSSWHRQCKKVNIHFNITYMLPMSRNHSDRWGTIAAIGTMSSDLCRSSVALWLQLKYGSVHYLLLSSHPFFCLPLFLCPGTVPCMIFIQRPIDFTTCPNHRNLLLSQLIRYLHKD